MATRLSLLLPCSSMTHHVAPSLPHPSDLLSAWSWRSSFQKKQLASSPDYQQHSLVLPPIKNLDLDSPSPSPDYDLKPFPDPLSLSSPSTGNPSMQWYGPQSSPSTVSEKTAEMISYLWFSSKRDNPRAKRIRTSPSIAKIDPSTAAMQFSPTPKFIAFVRKLLETTQVSQSVIVLSLHYIYRLRQQNCNTPAQAGSEFRVAVIALMLANKFLDDNTYTNKTWSDVAGINLEELNRMEREFLTGIDSKLYVDKATYESWLQLLKGLVLAKEREHQQWQYLRRKAATSNSLIGQRIQHLNTDVPEIRVSYRPRSTSPRNATISRTSAFTFTMPSHTLPLAYPYSAYAMDAEDDSMHSGMKRSAASAVDYATPTRPTKRVATLQMDRLPTSGGPRSAGPAFSSVGSAPVDAFSSLSITSLDVPSTHSLHPSHSTDLPQQHQTSSLAQPYPLSQSPLNSQPQHLYFYTLAGSPLDIKSRSQVDRKAQLRYASAEPKTVSYESQLLRLRPLKVHSANVSPRDVTMHMGSRTTPWFDEPEQTQQQLKIPIPPLTPNNPLPSYHNAVPAAHFANAGPPGVQWSVFTPGSTSWTR